MIPIDNPLLPGELLRKTGIFQDFVVFSTSMFTATLFTIAKL
jgi:hypothetical protein